MRRAFTPHIFLALLVTLASTVSLPASATTSPTSPCAAKLPFPTFDVEAEARSNTYRIGQTALVDVWVTDKFTGLPQEDVDAGAFLQGRRDRAVFHASKTDEDGHALVRLPLRRSWVEPGWARTVAGAWESIVIPYYCVGRYGYREYPRLFRIRP